MGQTLSEPNTSKESTSLCNNKVFTIIITHHLVTLVRSI